MCIVGDFLILRGDVCNVVGSAASEHLLYRLELICLTDRLLLLRSLEQTDVPLNWHQIWCAGVTIHRILLHILRRHLLLDDRANLGVRQNRLHIRLTR